MFFLHLHIIRWSKYQLSASLGLYLMHLLFLLLYKTAVNGSVMLPFCLQISENPWLRKQEVLCKAASAQREPASIHDHPSCHSTCVGTRCSNRASTGLKVGSPGFCFETCEPGLPVPQGMPLWCAIRVLSSCRVWAWEIAVLAAGSIICYWNTWEKSSVWLIEETSLNCSLSICHTLSYDGTVTVLRYCCSLHYKMFKLRALSPVFSMCCFMYLSWRCWHT